MGVIRLLDVARQVDGTAPDGQSEAGGSRDFICVDDRMCLAVTPP